MKYSLLTRIVSGAAFFAAFCFSTAFSADAGSSELQRLDEGNLRFSIGEPTYPHQSTERRDSLTSGQSPFATVITCSDSRVAPELLFDQGIGDLFVIRVAGNVSDVDEVGSIEYGVGHLSTPLLVVLGHSSCGAVTAVLKGQEVHGSIPPLVDNIAPAVARAKAEHAHASGDALLAEAVEDNVWVSIEDLIERSEETRHLIESGKLKVVGAVYHLDTGRVEWLGSHPNQSGLVAAASSHASHGATSSDHEENVLGSHDGGDTFDLSLLDSAELPTGGFSWIVGGLVVLVVVGASAWFFGPKLLQRWKVSRRLASGFACVVCLLLVVGFVGYEGMHVAVGEFDAYRADSRRSIVVGEMDVAFLEAMNACKDYMIYQSDESVRTFTSELALFESLVKRAPEFFDDSARLGSLERIETEFEAYAASFEQLRVASSAGERDVILASMIQNRAEIDSELNGLLKDIVRAQTSLGPVVVRDLHASKTIIVVISSISLVLGFVLSLVISRTIVLPLVKVADSIGSGAEQTASAADQVSVSSQLLAEGATEQAASVEESSASLEQIESMTERNYESTARVAELVDNVQGLVRAAEKQVAEMGSAMSEIKSASGDIGNIIKIIDDIAFQTNILALNAAVEAARAGEAGTGFAVVADEVRNLAQRSSDATRDTAGKVESSLHKTEAGVVVSAKVSESLSEIVGRVDEIAGLVREVSAASKEQSLGVGQLNIAIADIDKTTQRNASSAEETASAAEELNAQTECLRKVVVELTAMIHGSSTASFQSRSIPSRARQAPAPVQEKKRVEEFSWNS